MRLMRYSHATTCRYHRYLGGQSLAAACDWMFPASQVAKTQVIGGATVGQEAPLTG
jgi:hypothetical protein